MFKKARLKLTFWYVLIIAFITLSFSAILYTGVVRSSESLLNRHNARMERTIFQGRGFENNAQLRNFEQPISYETINEIKSAIFNILLITNLIIISIAAALSYLLAGITLKPIEQMVSLQKDFVANAAHEFKTPLTSIKVHNEVTLRKKKLTLKEAKETIKNTITQTDALNSLINILLIQSKYQSNKNSIEFEEFSLDSLIKQIIKDLAPRQIEKNLKITYNSKKININANKMGIKEVITIILDNAIKFSPEKSQIKVSSNVAGKYVVIKVKDQGPGISQKDMPHIFDRFYKAESSRNKDASVGFGLGLAIAQDIIKKHKGELTAQNNKQNGATFTIKIPRLEERGLFFSLGDSKSSSTR